MVGSQGGLEGFEGEGWGGRVFLTSTGGSSSLPLPNDVGRMERKVALGVVIGMMMEGRCWWESKLKRCGDRDEVCRAAFVAASGFG